MSQLKNYQWDPEEDGALPTLVTGQENNLKSILQNSKSDGGSLVTQEKIDRVNKQNDVIATIRKGDKIPISIITGYLGSGKSTLLDKISKNGSDKRIAVILNEFGDSNEIEKSMTINQGDSQVQEWLDLGNGCLCCSLKNIGVKAIEDMIDRAPELIDYILLETSGIADPAPIAKMFWQDDGLNSNVYIDGIITVLDSTHILSYLDDFSDEAHFHDENVQNKGDNPTFTGDDDLTIAHLQIAMADRIILNKYDLIKDSQTQLDNLTSRVKQINSLAPIFTTSFGNIELDKILNLHSYDSEKMLMSDADTEANLIKWDRPTLHDPRMSSVMLTFRILHDLEEFEKFISQFLQPILWHRFGMESDKINNDMEIQRTKGLVKYGSVTKVIQGVCETFDIFPGENEKMAECKLVIIGKNLQESKLQDFLNEIVR